MSADNRLRRMTLVKTVLQKSVGTKKLSERMELSQQAGEVIARVTRPFRFDLDFTNGRCKIEDNDVLVILTDEAMQLNRLKQLRTRMMNSLISSGIPISEIRFRILPNTSSKQDYLPPATTIEDHVTSLYASWEISEQIDLMPEKVRDTFRLIAKHIRPKDSELRSHMTSSLDAEAVKLGNISSRFRVALKSLKAPIPLEFYLSNTKTIDKDEAQTIEKENREFSTRKSICEKRIQALEELSKESMMLSISMKASFIPDEKDQIAPIPSKEDEAEFIKLMKKIREEIELSKDSLSLFNIHI